MCVQVLPDSLADAVADAAAATAAAINGGSTRCQVEILLPEFWDPISGPIFPNKGDQVGVQQDPPPPSMCRCPATQPAQALGAREHSRHAQHAAITHLHALCALQERFWRMTKRFVEELGAATKSSQVKAVRRLLPPPPAQAGPCPASRQCSRVAWRCRA